MMLAAAIVMLAIVSQDQSALRAAPQDSATTQALLWQGEVLEVRGEKGEFVQVYDHRLERAGYIRSWQLRTISTSAEGAPELLAVVRYLHDVPGAESLGIAYSAAYLHAAPADAITGEIFEALGTFGERLARMASARQMHGSDAALSAHLEVASSYGMTFKSFDAEGRAQLCYDGEAFRRVMALPSSDVQKARAALALTRADCIDPALPPTTRASLDIWRADVLNRVPLTTLAPFLKNRIHLARAGVYASLAFEAARRSEPDAVLAQSALDELAAVVPAELPESDAGLFTEASIRVSSVRWATVAAPLTASRITVATQSGEPGQTCITLTDATHDAHNPLISKCTYGLVWTTSARSNAQGSALALAVTPSDGWRELWMFEKTATGWTVAVLPPGLDGVALGYSEFAGWVPGAGQFLAVREARLDGHYTKTFEVIELDTLEVKKHADAPGSINAFYRWQDPQWKQMTLSLRDGTR